MRTALIGHALVQVPSKLRRHKMHSYYWASHKSAHNSMTVNTVETVNTERKQVLTSHSLVLGKLSCGTKDKDLILFGQ